MIQRYRHYAPLLLAELLIAFDLNLPLIRPVLALVLLLGVPTRVLHLRLGLPGSPAERLLYAFGINLLGVILVGVLLNNALHLGGMDRPLQPLVIALASLVVNVALLEWRADRAPFAPPDWQDRLRRLPDARFEPAQSLAVVAVVVAILGAIRLNNGAGGGMAVAGELLGGVALVLLLVRREGSLARDVRTIALVAAALLLATSLRGWTIVGHDIQSEYFAFRLTDQHQLWQMSSWHNAYNACLSVNILPTMLAQTTGLSGVLVFKLLLQLVFALVPALTYLLARRYLTRRLSLGAAILTMAFPTFFNDMPYLVRQEIAFFFLALFLLVATEPERATRRVRLLAGVFGLGVILSHYSTTYVMLIGLVLGLVALGVFRLLARRWPDRFAEPDDERRSSLSKLVLLNPVLVLSLILVSWAWTGPATHTGGQAAEVAKATIAAVFGKGDKEPGSSDRSYTLFARDKTTPRQRLNLYVHETIKLRKTEPGKALVKKPSHADLRPVIAKTSTTPLTGPGKVVRSVVPPTKVNTAARLLGAGLLQIFLIVGMFWLMLRRRRTGDPVPEEIACLSVGAVGALALIVLIPKLSVDYGVLRAFQQTLLVVAPATAMGMWLILRRLAKAPVLAVVIPVGLLLVFSGALPSLLGGYPGRIALSNSGLYFDRHYASDSEVQASAWLATVSHDTGSRTPIIAKKNIAFRVLSDTLEKQSVSDRLFPTLLTKGSYVFLDAQVVRKKQSTVFYTGDHITYDYPMKDLDQRLDLVYSSQLARIYR